MGDVPRKPRNWEILIALESVSPPSPSPSLGSDVRLSNFSSVGEIPIILDVGIESDVSATSVSSALTSPRPQLPASSSAATLGTIGTFGPRRPVSGTSSVTSLAYSSRDSLSTLHPNLGDVTPTGQSAQFLSPPQDAGYYDRRRSDVSGFTLSTYLSPAVQQITSTDSYLKLYQLQNEIADSAHDQSSTLPLANATSRSNSSLSTLLFAPGSTPISPASTRDVLPGAQMHAATAKSAHQFSEHTAEYTIYFAQTPPGSPSLRSGTPTIRSIDSNQSSPARLLPSRYNKSHGWTKSTSTTASNGSDRSAYSNNSARSHSSQWLAVPKPLPDNSPAGPHAASNLPGVLSWLEDVTIELWIDQEGFRLSRPAFRLSTYSGPSSQDTTRHSRPALTHGVAEFLPIDEKQTYVYHHAPLDPPPVLRKMVMAGDDTRDYISRQASLVIKSNGVYSVSGTETFDPGPASPNAHAHGPAHLAPPQTGHQPLKLTWRFEYHVDDIRPGSPPRGRQAEKRLTPLSFSCSPGLLHPSHGKKVKLMQVVKKGLTPKLSSAKVEDARRLPPRGDVPVDVSPEKMPLSKIQNLDTRAFKMSSVSHRRAHSTSTAPPMSDDESHDRIASEGTQATSIKKNRATSVILPLLHRSDSTERLVQPAPINNDAVFQLPRHILPPVEINHLLDEQRDPPYRTESGHARSLPPPWRHA
ncbi:hypothetical protein EIP86_004566 [Pleurotus ostreatoroseus]|nr:hypothetical protein EIP86_004566 [Pleurotus ostreatoroseus]